MTSLIIFILKKYGKQNTHHHHFLHKEEKKTFLIETGPAVTGSLLPNHCHFFFATLFDYLNVFISCWKANKINKDK